MRLYSFIHKSAILIIVFISINLLSFYLIEIYYHLEKIKLLDGKENYGKQKSEIFIIYIVFEYEIITCNNNLFTENKNRLFRRRSKKYNIIKCYKSDV